MIAETMGVYVKCDVGIMLKSNMEAERICVRTKKMDWVADALLLKLKEHTYDGESVMEEQGEGLQEIGNKE